MLAATTETAYRAVILYLTLNFHLLRYLKVTLPFVFTIATDMPMSFSAFRYSHSAPHF